jgi:hypothetical protein
MFTLHARQAARHGHPGVDFGEQEVEILAKALTAWAMLAK